MRTLAIALVVIIVLVGIAVVPRIRYGLSSREQPTLMEEAIARGARHFATAAAMRNAKNPTPLNDEVLADARAHRADHCATCHANDGSGNTEIGRNLYPKAPDMRGTTPRTTGSSFTSSATFRRSRRRSFRKCSR